ncbi:hypothetical protein PSHT_11079 [Puccinia striiformis]|uniref:Uncharacterized protein n=1 Tax=Puccinia striiformis TaxID=27350 RepID=A0A2S4V5M5_9BASI|nr:hypothetical protein PSHT_11079 [Puccinia striiformis]
MTLYNEKGNRNENRTKKVRNERASDRQDGTQDQSYIELPFNALALSLFMLVKSSSLPAYSKSILSFLLNSNSLVLKTYPLSAILILPYFSTFSQKN